LVLTRTKTLEHHIKLWYNTKMDKDLEVNNLKLSPKEQENLRKRIIRVALKNLRPDGTPYVSKVAEICECSKAHVSSTWKKYKLGGVAGIKAIKIGRPKNSGKLTIEQQKEVRKLIIDKCPEQLKLKGFLWDRQNIQRLIKDRYDITITLQNISVYLKSWGMTPQRPITKSYKQQPEQIKKWLDEDYPKIKEQAKKENAEILWGDETGCQNETNYVKGYAPIGQTPTMPIGNTKLRINMISAISNQGKLRFMFYEGSMNAKLIIEFMSRLLKRATRKIFLILDNLSSHHAKIVREWLAKRIDKIQVFFLPPYAPQYNPDEYLNGNLKREMAKEKYSETTKELEDKARNIMRKIQKDHKHVASFFQKEEVRYAG